MPRHPLSVDCSFVSSEDESPLLPVHRRQQLRPQPKGFLRQALLSSAILQLLVRDPHGNVFCSSLQVALIRIVLQSPATYIQPSTIDNQALGRGYEEQTHPPHSVRR